MGKVTEPPNSPPYYDLWANKFDFEIARNILLNFIHEKGLDEEFIVYLEQHFPEDEDGRR